VETLKDSSVMIFSFLFLFLFYIENNNKGIPEGKENKTNFSKTIFHRKSSHLLGQKAGHSGGHKKGSCHRSQERQDPEEVYWA